MFRTVSLSDPRFETDGLRCVTVKSPALRGRGDVTVWSAAGERPVALVILLHGVYGSHWSWALQGGAHRTARRLLDAGDIPALALAMPGDGLRGDGTGYLRHGDGIDYGRWIADEVAEAARAALPALDQAAPCFIAGLSMGGFGALRIGARHHGRFRGIAAHSSITHLAQMAQFIEEDVSAWGADVADGSALAAILTAGSALPPLRLDCGLDDQLIADNRALHAALVEHRVPHAYDEFPGGHEWSYWELHLADTLRFFAECLRV